MIKQIKIVRHVYYCYKDMIPSLGYVYVNCYKTYKEYKIAITKSIDYNGEYCLTDIETGLKAHTKRFFTLKHAKSFMEHTEDINFIKWYEELEKARKTRFYATYPKVNKL